MRNARRLTHHAVFTMGYALLVTALLAFVTPLSVSAGAALPALTLAATHKPRVTHDVATPALTARTTHAPQTSRVTSPTMITVRLKIHTASPNTADRTVAAHLDRIPRRAPTLPRQAKHLVLTNDAATPTVLDIPRHIHTTDVETTRLS